MSAADTTGEVPEVPLLIGGEPLLTNEWLEVMDPAAPARSVGRVALASAALARRAVESASRAARQWAELGPERRAEALLGALAAVEPLRAECAELLVRENGKIKREAEADLGSFVARCRLAAELVVELQERRTLPRVAAAPGAPGVTAPPLPPGAPAYRTEIQQHPLGVVTIIVPFNWPLAILGASLPYALVAGNAVIVKPPPSAPLALSRVLHALAARLPPGVLSVVSGSNEAVAPLISDARVGRVVFTGSSAGGKAVMQLAASNLSRVTLELGGNDPALILDDAALDAAALQRLSVACFLTAGQVCMAVKRIYVARSRYDELVTGLSALLGAQRVGSGLLPTTTMGPLNSARQRDFVRSLCAEARAAGHEVRELGDIDAEALDARGHYLRPALVLDPRPDLRIVTEEQFGPAVPILPFDSLDPLIEQLNSEWSGLGSSVWSADLQRAAAVARRLRMGSTWINNASALAMDNRAPFGGFRQSGLGRELGSEGLREFTEPQTITFPV